MFGHGAPEPWKAPIPVTAESAATLWWFWVKREGWGEKLGDLKGNMGKL